MKKNIDLQARKVASFARGQGNAYDFYVEKAKNAEIWDVEGNRYIDFGSGIAVCNTGHSNPQVVDAIKGQLDKLSHSCVMVTPYEPAVELAEKLTAVAPIKGDKKAIFITTGAEAVENCIKIARSHTKRRGVIAFQGGFHGRTNLAMALTGKVDPYKHEFGPFPSDIYHIPFPTSFHGISTEDTLSALKRLWKTNLAPDETAAIIIEPVQGEGGFYPAPVELLKALRELCDEHGIVLIADEIQTGFARTGKMFAVEHSGVSPDLMTMAKGIAGGFPISAVVGKAEIMDSPKPGALGGTYGGSPLGCAAGIAVLDIIKKEGLAARANEIGAYFSKRLNIIKDRFPESVGEVRNLGAMIALELVSNGDSNQPNPALTQKITAAAKEHGLVLLSCGFYGNVIRFLPALTISDETLTEGLDSFERLFEKVAK